MTPYRPENAPGLAPHAETLALCSCGECRAERLRVLPLSARVGSVRVLPDAALWGELTRRAR